MNDIVVRLLPYQELSWSGGQSVLTKRLLYQSQSEASHRHLSWGQSSLVVVPLADLSWGRRREKKNRHPPARYKPDHLVRCACWQPPSPWPRRRITLPCSHVGRRRHAHRCLLEVNLGRPRCRGHHFLVEANPIFRHVRHRIPHSALLMAHQCGGHATAWVSPPQSLVAPCSSCISSPLLVARWCSMPGRRTRQDRPRPGLTPPPRQWLEAGLRCRWTEHDLAHVWISMAGLEATDEHFFLQRP
jgi:hypothetical protein